MAIAMGQLTHHEAVESRIDRDLADLRAAWPEAIAAARAHSAVHDAVAPIPTRRCCNRRRPEARRQERRR
jgi:hypothetical protein